MAYARLDEPIGDAAATRAPPPPRCGTWCAEILPVGRRDAARRPKSAADPRDEDVAFFYAEEANHDAEEAIFEELYGTSTTTVPPGA